MSTPFRRTDATRCAAALLLGSSTLALLPALSHAQPAGKAAGQASPMGSGYVATVGKSGEVTVTEGEKPDAFVTIRPGLFEPGWQYRTATFDRASGKSHILASGAGSTVTLTPTVTLKGNTLTISCSFLADKDTPVN